MALSFATCSGWAWVNSGHQLKGSGHNSGRTLDSIPKRGNSLDIFVKRECESIDLLLILHDKERIVCYLSALLYPDEGD
jgi:hypothetical protein